MDVDRATYQAILRACRALPKPRGNYHDRDYVSVFVDTVIDYRLNETITGRAYQHFEDNRWDSLRTARQLRNFLARFPDTKAGNVKAARALWGYGYGNRLQQLRRLTAYFDSIGVRDGRSLRGWARASSFEVDFKGRVKGLGFAVYKWLVIRLGVETVKPDSRLRRFLRRAARRDFSDAEVVAILERVAKALGLKAHMLDWAIWDDEGERQARTRSR
jgi:hypothetical protein